MGKIQMKYENLFNALNRLNEAVDDFDNLDSESHDEREIRIYRSFRDSMIQRFELSVDLFWKYLKTILEEEFKNPPEYNTPKSVVRMACSAKLITEQDAEIILKMIEDRNMTSHIYKEEVADQISSQIGKYLCIMKRYLDLEL